MRIGNPPIELWQVTNPPYQNSQLIITIPPVSVLIHNLRQFILFLGRIGADRNGAEPVRLGAMEVWHVIGTRKAEPSPGIVNTQGRASLTGGS